MPSKIDTLTDEQAIRAIGLLYDLLPAAAWENQNKPSSERVKTLAAGLKEEAPADLKPAVEALLATNQPAVSGEVSRFVLNQMAGSDALRPSIEQAVDTACEAHMGIDPATGAYLLALLVMAVDVSKTSEGYKVLVGLPAVLKHLRLPEVLEKLPPALRALPGPLIKALTQGLGGKLDAGKQ